MSVSFAGARRLIALGVTTALLASVPSVLVTSTAGAETPSPVAGAELASSVPSILGLAAATGSVSVDPGRWTAAVRFTYQWYLDGRPIQAETTDELGISPRWEGQWITVAVTGSRAGYTSVTRWSQAVQVMGQLDLWLKGEAVVGATLKVFVARVADGMRLSYQWLRDGVPIRGATKKAYLVTATDLGKLVQLRVTVTRPGKATVSFIVEEQVDPVEASERPSIAGSVALGSVLRAKPGNWGDADFEYQWNADGDEIDDANWPTFAPTKYEVGKRITVTVTGKRPGYDYGYQGFSRTSAATAKLLRSSTPKVSGTRKVGSRLTARPGKWTSRVALSYRWLRDGVAIPGATKKVYQFTAADRGKQVAVRVTGKRPGYATTSRDSAPAPGIPPTLTAGFPSFSGWLRVGETMKVDPGYWTPGVRLAYQWYVDGRSIGGDSPVLRLGYRAAGQKLSVVVTGSKAGFTSVKRKFVLGEVEEGDPYRVGVDIPAGTYVSKGPWCWWFRSSKKDARDSDDALGESFTFDNSLTDSQQLIVTLHAGEYLFSEGCAPWAVLDLTPKHQTGFGNGDFAVGVQVAPGRWRATEALPTCLLELATGFDGSSAEVVEAWYVEAAAGSTDDRELRTENSHRFDQSTTDIEVRIPPSATRVSSDNCGTWERVGD